MIKPPLSGQESTHRRQLAMGLSQVIDGQSNAAGSFVIGSTDTSTDVADLRAGIDSVIVLMPTNAAAATEFGSGALYVSTRGAGTFTVTSTATAASRTFDYAILGTGHE